MQNTDTISMKSNPLVLVVDDCILNRIATSIAIRAIGYPVHQASGGAEALNMLKEHSYDLIIMDYLMPEMSGIDCDIEIRRMEDSCGARVPIICFTSCDEPALKERCLDAGMDLVLDKGCSELRFRNAVEMFISRMATASVS